MTISPDRRSEHLACLLDLSGVPTATGHEHLVVRWIEDWLRTRDDLRLSRDRAGNLVVSMRDARGSEGTPRSARAGGDARPIFITAHLDHPAFHVERRIGRDGLELSFRGGVMDDYFPGSRIIAHGRDGSIARGEIIGAIPAPDSDMADGGRGGGGPFTRYDARLDDPSRTIEPGDFAVWDLPASELGSDGIVRAPACDDLAAAAAALAAIDELRLARARGEPVGDVRLLFTLGEEVGFIGAIAACRFGTIPADARVIALENSRSSAEAPIAGGPIVRVGDRLSVFHPGLTRAIDRVCERIAGGSAPTASEKLKDAPAWKWQRRLMSGGACEATVFCAMGLEATCVCLPLGNYHNMASLDDVQASRPGAIARIDREFIALRDFEGMVDLLVACGTDLPEAGGLEERLETLWEERRFVLGL